MPSYDPVRHRRDCDRALAPFCQHPDLPFPDLLTGADVARAFAAADVHFGTSRPAVYTPPVVLWGWLSQGVHKEKACLAAAFRSAILLLVLCRPPGDSNSGTYCRARAKMPAVVLRAPGLPGRSPPGTAGAEFLVVAWPARPPRRWLGGVDARSTGEPTSLPPTARPAAGWGFPLLRLVLIVSLVTACVQELAFGPWQGKETGETALFRTLLATMLAGDIAVLDRYYGSYFMVAEAQQSKVDMVVRLHQRRSCDFSRGQRLGRDDHVVVWRRPERPDWMRVEAYEAMPKTLTVREVRVRVAEPGFRVETLVVVTTLLDEQVYDKEEIGDLYRQRWHVELDIRSLKIGLQMDQLRCLTPFMIEKKCGRTC